MQNYESLLLKLEELEKRIYYIKKLGISADALLPVTTDITKLKQDVLASMANADVLKQGLTLCNNEVAALKTDTASKFSDLETNLSDFETIYQQNFKLFSEQISTFETNLEGTIDILTNTQTSVNNIASNMQTLSATQSNHSIQLSSQETKVLSLETALNSVSASDAALHASHSALASTVSTLSGDLQIVEDNLQSKKNIKVEFFRGCEYSYGSGNYQTDGIYLKCKIGSPIKVQVSYSFYVNKGGSAMVTRIKTNSLRINNQDEESDIFDCTTTLNYNRQISTLFYPKQEVNIFSLLIKDSTTYQNDVERVDWTFIGEDIEILTRNLNYYAVTTDEYVTTSQNTLSVPRVMSRKDKLVAFSTLNINNDVIAYQPKRNIAFPKIVTSDEGLAALHFIGNTRMLMHFYIFSKKLFLHATGDSTVTDLGTAPLTFHPCFALFQNQNPVCVCGISDDSNPYVYSISDSTNKFITLNGSPIGTNFLDCTPVQKKVLHGTAFYECGYILTDLNLDNFYIDKKDATLKFFVGNGKNVNAYLQSNGNIHIYLNIENIIIKKVFEKDIVSNTYSLTSTSSLFGYTLFFEGASTISYGMSGCNLKVLENPIFT